MKKLLLGLHGSDKLIKGISISAGETNFDMGIEVLLNWVRMEEGETCN